mmetsp:Transcript_46655/g.77751  ORF Transcript_46655/g.77751 Transcript_46655/m.77751 type:complete len:101 (+) Transcript_46655:296-598(+)|eukprot:CAMPEP_0184654508 /NCGR_PEP_ID=MMETSP0308-20130426/12183_1 /TAXON_ID=38269 /ORGANISM="Gloeochaete witrockiana, Strain SAG 46.84" /LENGTH=100 /DNA_ID=CAMNT_0027090529 /DNA_START=277 /DNA_END=579 /DNA_ORIENTATION=-
MANLNQIVYLALISNHRIPPASPINTRVCTYLNIVPNNDSSQLRVFCHFPLGGINFKSETILSYGDSMVNDAVRPNLAIAQRHIITHNSSFSNDDSSSDN